MKRLKFLIFFTIILVINTYRQNIIEKSTLVLDDRYYIYKVIYPTGILMQSYEVELSLNCPEYSVIVKDESPIFSDIYKDKDDYCGKLEKISRIGNYWVGRNFDHKDKLKKINSEVVSESYIMRADEMIEKINEIIDKHEGYFIIGDDVEYFNLTYRDLQKFFNSNFIILNDAYWYIKKHGEYHLLNDGRIGDSNFTPKYYHKFASIYNYDYEKFFEIIPIYEKERIEKLLWLILLLIIQIINFVKVGKKIRKVI